MYSAAYSPFNDNMSKTWSIPYESRLKVQFLNKNLTLQQGTRTSVFILQEIFAVTGLSPTENQNMIFDKSVFDKYTKLYRHLFPSLSSLPAILHRNIKILTLVYTSLIQTFLRTVSKFQKRQLNEKQSPRNPKPRNRQIITVTSSILTISIAYLNIPHIPRY